TFWVDAGAEPSCSLERLALGVLGFHTARCPGEPRACGAEWWVQVRSSGGMPTIPLHWDSDEEHKATSGEHVPPWLGTVTYLGSRGAPTVLLPVVADAHGRAVRAGADAFISHPLAGKHLCFDGRLMHGALHDLGETSTEEYVRTTLLVNLWVGHRPGGTTARLPGTVAAAMSDLDAVCFDRAREVRPVQRHPGSMALASDAGAAWRSLRVNFAPLRQLCARQPDWRGLARLIGYPFAHPDVGVRWLPWHCAGPRPPSLVLVPKVGLRLPFENGAGEDEEDQEQDGSHVDAAKALLQRALEELSASGDWRAERELRRAVPALRGLLPVEDDSEDEGNFEAPGGVRSSTGQGGGASSPGPLPRITGEPVLMHLASTGLTACALCYIYGRAPAAYAQDPSGHQLAINAGDADGFTALHYAANLGLEELVPPLLELGASVHAANRDVTAIAEPGGRTPLHLAAASGHMGVVHTLLAAGADAQCEDWVGSTPALLAYRRGHWKIGAAIAGHTHRGGCSGCADGGGGSSGRSQEVDVPGEQELQGLELVETFCMRTRRHQRLSIEGRHRLHTPFVLRPVFSSDVCADLIAAAERAGSRRGWQSTRHKHHPTVDLPLHDLSPSRYDFVRRTLEGGVLPAMQKEYDTNVLLIREAFVVKYEAAGGGGGPEGRRGPRQAGLGMHRDGTLLNCVVLLSSPADFEGGGTVFAPPIDRTFLIGQGECLCSCGQLLHGANSVTRGTRYVLIAFLDELQEPPKHEDE
ncbi:unnamed protein product, partial [Prorocentrum cordatum]